MDGPFTLETVGDQTDFSDAIAHQLGSSTFDYIRIVRESLQQSVDASAPVVCHIFSFKKTTEFASALEYLAPMLTEWIRDKRRAIVLEIGDMIVRIVHADDVPTAVMAINRLANAQPATQ